MVGRQSIFQTMESGVIKSYIWTFVNRFLHYFLIFSFSIAYVCANIKGWFDYHLLFGFLFGAGVLLRIIWGFIGTKYSRFSDFNFSGIFSYLTSIFGVKKRYIGHNPASSLAIIIIFVLGLMATLSGIVQYGAEDNSGIFSYLFFEYHRFEVFEGLHKLCVNWLLGVIIIHICGSLIDKFISKNDTLDSIISGYKITYQEESVALSFAQKMIFTIYLIFLSAFFIYLLYPKNIFLRPHNLFAQNKSSFAVYRQECGSCHIAYAPYLLPKIAWDSMMSDLENHFGDDASLDAESHKTILTFLNQYASDFMDTKMTSKIAKESSQNKIAITEYAYWQAAHRKINPAIFATSTIKSKANCQTCHRDAESGIFAKNAIDYAKLKNLKEQL